MWKALVVVAVTANTFLITPTEGSKKCHKPNEVFDVCPAPCPPQECGVNIALILCAPAPKIGDPTCKPSCRCADGFLRNKTGICIPKSQCPPECPKNEVFDTCLAPCPPLECGVNKTLIRCAPCPKPGDPDCVASCRCADGYLRNKAGKCIPEKECPYDCPVNEVYDICPASCPPLRCDVNKALIRCAAPPKPGDPKCKPSCRCADGFLRNKDGTCIPEAQCPRKCPKNEVFDVCPATCPPLVCGVNKDLIRCAAPLKPGDPNCDPSCRCADGFLRNKAGVCVPEAECPSACGANEELSPCSNGGCGPWTCSDLGIPTGCVKMDPKNCREGCVCKEGFVKNDNGTCIPSTECSECGGDPNAIAGCGINCGRLCSNYSKGPVSCTAECLRNACDCREGFVLDEFSNKCVRPFECKCNKPNEHYDPCPPKCPPETCESIGKKYECPISPAVCEGECRCDKGYFRNKIGNCIKGDDCLKCTGPNEYFSCGGACDNVCATINKQNQTICPIVNIQCNSMCYCEEGYARDANNICIPIKKCPAPQCKDDERYEQCPDWLCTAQTCSQVGFPIACPGISGDANVSCPGSPCCVCDNDLVRNDKGKCVPPNQCPSCGGDPNAKPGCGVNCGRRCSNYNKGPAICPLICNINGCDCKDGFVYDDNLKKCVLPKDCTRVCNNNEVYDLCANGGCQKRNCSQLGQPDFCTNVTKCIGGCVCAKGFLKAKNGTCVPENQCPIPSCPKHERFECCPGRKYSPQSCSEVGFPLQCPEVSNSTSCKGPPKCICKDGYVRKSNGKCISIKKCPSCGGDPNAVSGCGTNSCNRLCSNYNKPPVPCPRICRVNACDCKEGFVFEEKLKKCVRPNQCTPVCGINEIYDTCSNGGCQKRNCSQLHQPDLCIDVIKCFGGCVCKEGFLRTKKGNCVPQKECPTVPTCPNNERFVSCPDTLCIPQSCTDVGFPVPCPVLAEKSGCPGPPKCVCSEGYVRNSDGKCVPVKQCPSCGGDPNAVSGCGTNSCNRLCSNYDKPPVPCPKICKVNACDCKKGFVFDENISKCVLPKKCSPICGKDEVFSECINGGCQAKNCSQLGKPVPCIKIDPKFCIKGCLCKEGYLRRDDGVCVPKDKCNQCNKPNEYYDSCPLTCPPQTCESIGRKYKCPIKTTVCKGACRCNKGYFRNKIGECIKANDCLKCKGPNEYFSCGGACDNVCLTLNEQNQTNCPIFNVKCNPMCYCEKGYARNNNNTCVPIKECPVSCGGDPNAKPGCGVNCGRRCSDNNKGPAICPLICNINGCDCKDGFVYDEKLKKCVLPKDCTRVCNNNEVYDLCANGGCQKRNCSQLGQPDFCTNVTKCIGGCVCAKGFLKAKNGTCVPENQCPIPACPKHERFEWCPGRKCSPQSCSEVGFPLQCPEVSNSSKCQGPPRCICKDGYVRKSNGKCKSIKKCPSCGGDPNAVSGCGTNSCNKLCSNYDKPPVPCPKICKVNACDCKKGFVFDENISKCVLPKKCSPICGKDEVFSECINGGCQAKNCSQLGKPVPCIKIDPKFCIKGCLCKEGYLRRDDGVCVPKDKCNTSCGGDPNAVSGCGTNSCNKLCSNYDKPPVPCPKVCKVNACDCKKGFVFDENISKCVLPKKCSPICGKDEVFSECINGGCQAKNCSQLGKPVPCIKIDPKFCIKGCLCKEGYLRRDDGVCVPKDKCNKCNKPNEYYDSCPLTCPPQTCESIGRTYKCPIKTTVCKGACRCNKGYFRNKIGECIKANDCLKCKGPNEYFSCGGACDNVCLTLNKQNQTNCPIVNIKCNPMCYCEKGYARNNNNTCVPIKKCPVSCGGDPNAKPGCGVNCGRRCSDCNKGPAICLLICNINGCDCKDGFVYDDNLKKCVLPKDCTPVCGNNEIYDTCANGGCQNRNCSQFGQPTLCIDPIKCKGGCVCKAGYLRAKNGTCIPENQCSVKCTGPNEHFACGGACDNVCDTLCKQNQTNCPIINKKCNPKCYCDKGYARDTNNICIPIKQCGESCHGDPNAVEGCGTYCGRRCSNYKKGIVACPAICMLNACDCKQNYVYDDKIKKCVLPKDCSYICRDGYLRVANRNYVPIHQCPKTCDKSHVVSRSCLSTRPLQTCKSHDSVYVCPIIPGQKRHCNPGCVCKEAATNTTSPPSTAVNITEATERLNDGAIIAAGKFLYQLASSSPNDNIILSGTSVIIALSQLALFTTGLVLEQLLNFFNLRNKDEIRTIFPELIKSYQNQTHVEFSAVTKYYANKDYPLSAYFKQESKRIFNSTGENLDFNKAVEAAKTINKWVNDNTNGKIQDLVKPEMFGTDTRLVLVNAIYFLGNWVHQFNPNNTKHKDFYKSNGETVTVEMMFQKNNFYYTENDQYQTLKMDYKGNAFSCVIVLPRKKDGLLDTIKTLQNPQEFKNMLKKLRRQEVEVNIPKMLIKTEMNIAEMLEKENVTAMFNPNNKNFEDILEKKEDLYVSAAVQQAYLSFNEVGTEAAAATAVVINARSLKPAAVFNANHPYIFYIMFGDTVLFCGSFVK